MSYVLPATEVMGLIPNRYPICRIDYVDILESGKKIVATRSIMINEDFLQGYFPDDPMMPGTLILEALVQAGSTLILESEEFLGKRAYIGGINRAEFRQKVVPGDVLKCYLEIVKMKGSVSTALSAAYVGDKKVYECEFTLIVNRNA